MIKGKGWVSQTAKEEYTTKFFFYFVKPINSVVMNESCPPNILFKDLLYWDQNTEIMRRYYTIPESEVRLRNYIASYEELYDRYPPNLCIIKPFKILLKRSKRYLDQMRAEQEEKLQRKNRRRGYDQLLPNLMKTPVYLTSKDFSNSYHNSKLSKEGNDSEPSANIIDRIKFDTKLHDIYDPEYSSVQSIEKEEEKFAPILKETYTKGKMMVKSKSNTNLVGGFFVASKHQTKPIEKPEKEEKLLDLFQKYKTKTLVESTLTKNSQEKFEAAIRLNQNYNDRRPALEKNSDTTRAKKESTNATETEQTREKIVGIHSKFKPIEQEDAFITPGYATSRSSNPSKSKPLFLKDPLLSNLGNLS